MLTPRSLLLLLFVAVLLLLCAPLAPLEFRGTTKAEPLHNMFYSAEVAPGVLTLHLSPYLARDDYGDSSPQLVWFSQQLKKVERMIHTLTACPTYSLADWVARGVGGRGGVSVLPSGEGSSG
jgi:hypothetical protein